MFKNDFQGGPCFEIFSPQQKESTSCWKVTGTVRKNYEKDVKGYAYILEGATATTKITLPKDARTSLHLVQRYLIVQLYLKKGADFSMEFGVADMKNNKRRIFLSTAQKDIHITPLHAKVPLKIVKNGVWLNLVLDLVSMVSETWRGETFKLLESVSISANCRVRRIFTMKCQPPETVEDNELYGYSPQVSGETDMVPKQCQFAADVEHYTQLLTIDKIRHAERLRGGGEVRGSVSSAYDLDLNASGRKSTANDSFHIAFGSKVPGVRTSQSAGKKTSRESSGNLTNRSIRSHSRAEDGISTTAYQEDMSISINSRDGFYTGRDPGGGGIRDTGGGEVPPHIPIPPHDKALKSSVRKGHQRQYSDPSSFSQMESDAKNMHDVPLVQPHPPREPSHERVRRRPRVKNGSAGKSRISSTGTQNGTSDEGIGSSLSYAVPNHHSNVEGRLDGEPLNTSTSSNDSGPRGKSAENARKPPVDIRMSKPQRKEYRPSNYQPDGMEVEESMAHVIEILNQHKLQFDFNDSLEEGDQGLDTGESEEEDRNDDNTYLFVSQPKPAPRQKNASPSQYLFDVETNKPEITPPKVTRPRDLKSRGPRPEEDFIGDNSSDEEDKQRLVISRPGSGSRPNSGTRPGSGARPSSGTRPNSGSRPGSGSRTGKPSSAGRSQTRTLFHPPNSNNTPQTVTSNSVQNGAIPIEIKVPSLDMRNMEDNEMNAPPTAGSPSFTSGITDRSCVSRVSRKSLREVPISRFNNSISDEKQVYDFSKYVMEDLSASAEARMLEEIQGARSEEFEPDNRISPRKEELQLRKSPRKSAQFQRFGGEGMLKGLHDDSPTTSEDDTSFSTWKAPPQPPHLLNHQKEMKARLSSDTLTSSNQGDWSGKCSPPVLIARSGLASNSLDDISTLGTISPRKAHAVGSPANTDDEELDLLYDQQLNCYYDPKTCKYYELS